MNNTYKTNKTDWRRLGRSVLFVALLLGVALPAQARDYVITWTNGGTTYYVGMNGNNIAVKTEFDITCVWTCRNGNNDANLGNTSYSLRNKNNTTYFLTTTCSQSGDYWSGYTYTWSALTVQNSASNIWRSSNGTNGNVYAYNSSGSGWTAWNRSASIRVVNNAWAMYDNNTNGSQNSQVTTTTPGASSPTTAEIGTLTVTPIAAALYQGENEAFTASASVTVTNYSIPAHTKYTFTVGSTDYEYFYYNNTRYTSIDDFSTKTTTTQTPSYAWTKTGDDGSNASLSSTNAASTTVTHATQAAADKSVTLTVTASYSGAESKTANAKVVLYGPMVAPTITRSGNSISIATTNINATIYYTTNGSTPTASSTPYTGSFDLTTSPTTVKAIAIRDGHSSTVTTETFNMQLPMPVISLTGAVATVTAGTGSPDGTKLYYTTDGNTPTSSSTEYTGGNITLTNPQTIKVIAIKSGYDNSEVAVAEYIVEGVNGGLVVLDDRENHSWSYYSDATLPEMMRSLNPADVKITYHGKGTKTVSTTNGATPAAASWTADATGVQVSYNEADSIFIYYKTLERTDGSSSLTPSGRCAYTVIPNPFSKRPLYGSGTDKWRGFYKWRIKSITGGKIWTAATGGTEKTAYSSGNYNEANCLDADVIYYFEPTNEYGMEVELEALWARAYVVENRASYMNNDGYLNSNNLAADSYERNFYVCTGTFNSGNVSRSGQKPVTISTRYPDGTAAGTSSTISGNFTCQNTTKLEYITFNASGSTLNANGKDLVVGRGVTGTMGNLYGLSANGTTSFRFRIESGTYTNLSFMGEGTGLTDGVMTATMGCDYDRAQNDNSKLKVTSDIILGHNATVGNSAEKGEEIFNCTVKSGNFDLGSYGGSVQFYISNWGDPTTYGKRTLTVEGGIFSDISGGMEDDGTTTVMMVEMRIKGGTINGAVYGAAQRSEAEGHRRMIITGGEFKGWIAGAANGNDISRPEYTGKMTGNTYLYVGGTARIDSDSATDRINRSVGGNVFGAGCGYDASHEIGYVVGNTNVVIADEAYIERGVYGGGSFGYASGTATIYILGGTVDCIGGGTSANGTAYSASVKGGVYGGACQNRAGVTNVKVYGGTVNGGVYGGGNVSGDVAGPITVDVYGTDPAPSANTYAIKQVFGGGNQAAFGGTPTVTVHCGADASTPISIEEVYGGGNQATVTGTNVTIEAGNIIGDVYGGGRQAPVGNGGTSVTVNGGTIRRVFGGNNISGAIANGTAGKIVVNVDKTSSCPMKIGQVFGGGNQAGSQVGRITVGCTGDLVTPLDDGQRYGYDQEGIGAVYGGANEANITGDITLNIVSGIVDSVFGGNNAGGSISGTITVNINKNGSAACAPHWYVGYVFGGGNNAAYNNNANNNPAVNVQAGLVTHHVFGGGNGSGATVTGNPTVTLSGTAEVGGNVFGGGNAAPVSGNTSVKLQN